MERENEEEEDERMQMPFLKERILKKKLYIICMCMSALKNQKSKSKSLIEKTMVNVQMLSTLLQLTSPSHSFAT